MGDLQSFLNILFPLTIHMSYFLTTYSQAIFWTVKYLAACLKQDVLLLLLLLVNAQLLYLYPRQKHRLNITSGLCLKKKINRVFYFYRKLFSVYFLNTNKLEHILLMRVWCLEEEPISFSFVAGVRGDNEHDLKGPMPFKHLMFCMWWNSENHWRMLCWSFCIKLLKCMWFRSDMTCTPFTPKTGNPFGWHWNGLPLIPHQWRW